MKRKLNRHRPFAEIYGNSEARYEQDGIQFDEAGGELPGFEHVEIVDDVKVITVTDPALAAELEQLKSKIVQLEDELETTDNLYEEEVSRASKLDVENRELKEQVASLQVELAGLKDGKPPVNPPKEADKKDGKPVNPLKETAGKSEIDAQLELQGKA